MPPGVFNLVNGDGPDGRRRDRRPPRHRHGVVHRLDARRRRRWRKAAADTVKRVAQELGGKSANIVLDDADLEAAGDAAACSSCFMNSGQILQRADAHVRARGRGTHEAVAIAQGGGRGDPVGDPMAEGTHIGPVVSEAQFDKIQGLIQKGIDEGATLVAGGPGRPDGLDQRLLRAARPSSPTCATT